MTKQPMIVAYYTKDTSYEQEAKSLRLSLEVLGLKHIIQGVPNLGSWQKNTQYKAVFLREMLGNFHPQPLWYVDVDAVLIRPPELEVPLVPSYDLGAVKMAGRTDLQSGTLLLTNTPKCVELVEAWVKLNEQYPERLPNGREAWDQRTLQLAVNQTPGVRFRNLPVEYCWIVGLTPKDHPKVHPIVVHTRGAYRLKSQIDEQEGDVMPWACVPTVNVEKARKTVQEWHDWNYKVAVLIEQTRATDEEAASIGADILLRPSEWEGFPAAANALVRAVPGPVAIVIGDDIKPHPQASGPVLLRQFLEMFPDTFGVMQPTGDVWGGFATCCISPWIGRKFIEKAYGGKGPYWHEYFHYFSDQELQEAAIKLKCFRQVRSIFQYHDHWQRRGENRPRYLLRAKVRWEDDRDLLKRRQKAGFPGLLG